MEKGQQSYVFDKKKLNICFCCESKSHSNYISICCNIIPNDCDYAVFRHKTKHF